MSVIRLANLGGLVPLATPRSLSENGAQTANNLLARTAEFRPLLTDTTAATTAVSNPKTLHRMARKADGSFNTDMSQGWIAKAGYVSFVKGLTNDEKTERTYYTFDDGSAAPRVVNALGYDKPLGVPPPATAPVGTVVANYSYTPETRTNELLAARDAAVLAIRNNLVLTWMGVDHPGSVSPGYHDMVDGAASDINNPDHAKVFRVLQVSAANTANVVNTFTGLPVSYVNPSADGTYLGAFDPRLGGFYFSASGPYGGNNWIADNTPVFAVPFFAYGRTYDFNTAAVKAALKLIKMPGTGIGTTPWKQLYTDAQIDGFLAYLRANYGATSARIAPLIARLRGSAKSGQDILDSGQISSIEFVINKQAELKLLSEAIGAEFDAINDELPSIVESYYNSLGIDKEVPVGTPRVIEDRFYICTYVTEWGEESAPSPVSELAELDENDTVTGSPPNPPAGYGIKKFRYYRTNSGATGAAFQFVDEVEFSAASLAGLATTTITDSKKSTELAEVCPSMIWLPPPGLAAGTTATPLRWLTGGANGIMAGGFDNTACFCEPYVPYAWPVEYQINLEYPIVGIGVFGQSFVYCTQGNPYVISGADSASMSAVKLDSPQSCVSEPSIVSGEGGVVYASPDGLCLVDHTGVKLVTEGLFTREDWQKITPSSIHAVMHEFVYYFSYTGNGGGTYALDLTTGKLVKVGITASTFYRDTATDRMYYGSGTNIVAAFAGTTYRTGVWRSGVLASKTYVAYAWLQVQADFTAPVTVRWYGDGALRYEVAITDRTPVRVPMGRYREHEVEIESTSRVVSVTLASSTAELQAV